MQMPVKLYHGTSLKAAQSILKKGLRPRGAHAGTWRGHLTSRPGRVYLTTVHALFFAHNASADDHWGLLEIDTRGLIAARLYPDEDFLRQSGIFCSNSRRAADHVYAQDCRSFWPASLAGLGVVAYRSSIAASKITRAWGFDPRTGHGVIARSVASVSLSLSEHAERGAYHQEVFEKVLSGELPGAYRIK
jgi:hypothetical protein